jgi:pimeloyl-ACP methyl ester carboxylesterase
MTPVPSSPPPTEPRAVPLVADDHGTGPVAVLLHGQPGDRHDWDRVVAEVGGRCRLLVPDRPGYGHTGGRAGGFDANAEAVIALLDRHNVAEAVMVGYSWGGAVALDVAQRHPGRVGGLVLVSSIGGPGSIDPLDRLLSTPVLGPLLSIAGLAMMRARRVRRLLVPTNPALADELPAGWLASWRSFVAEQRALVQELPEISARVASVAVPAVVVIGGVDRVVRPSSQQALADALPRAEVVRVEGGGHLLVREAAEVVADAIVRALGPVP